jgi:hypothetical protein
MIGRKDMSRNRYFVCLDNIYPKEEVDRRIKIACEKNGFNVPDCSHGYVSEVAITLGIEPADKIGNSKAYYGRDVILIVDEALRRQLKHKNAAKRRAKPASAQAPQSIEQETTKANEVSEPILTQTSSGQMSIEDLRLAQLEELKRKVYEAVDLFINALADLFN